MGEGYPDQCHHLAGNRADRDAITHYITIRYRRGITADYEVVCGDSVYRVKRQRDLNGARRFLLLECTELGECRQSHGGNNDDFLFAR